MTSPGVRSTDSLDIGSLGRQGAAAMLVRTVAMRLMSAAGTVVLARVLVPADFGVYAVLAVAQQLLAFLADFGVAPSLIQQEHDPTREELATAWMIQLAMWVICGLAIWAAVAVAQALDPGLSQSFAWQLRLLSFSIAFSMLRSLPSALLVRVLRFREIATIELAGHVAFWATAVTMALLGTGSWCFSIGLLLQSATGCLMANLICRYWPGIHFEWRIAWRMLVFGVAYQLSNVVITLRDGVVPVFGGLAGGVTAIGYLQFGLRIAQLTSSVDEIVARIAFPAFSRIKGDAARTERVLADMVTLVALLVGAPQAWLVATAPVAVPLVFGDKWSPSIPVLQLMCLSVLALVPARVAGTVVFGQGRPRTGLLVTVSTVAILYLLFPGSLLALGLVGGGLAYAVAGLVAIGMQARAVAPVARFPWAGLARVYGLAAISGGCAWAIVAGIGGWAGLALSALAYGGVYLALLVVFARRQLVRSWELTGIGQVAFVSSLLSHLPLTARAWTADAEQARSESSQRDMLTH